MTVRPTTNPYAQPVSEVGATRADAAGVSSSERDSRGAASAAAAPADRLELSATAREEAAQALRARADRPELEEARVALRASKGLSAEREQALRQQVASGHYDSPEAVDRIAAAVLGRR